MVFFAKACDQGWTCEKILTRKFQVRRSFHATQLWIDTKLVRYASPCSQMTLVMRKYEQLCTDGGLPGRSSIEQCR